MGGKKEKKVKKINNFKCIGIYYTSILINLFFMIGIQIIIMLLLATCLNIPIPIILYRYILKYLYELKCIKK